MSRKSANPWYHIIYWIIVVVVLSLVFGRSWYNESAAVFFVSMLLPVVLGTSYFFNYILVPNYLLRKRYFWFGLYTFYLIVISIYLEVVILTFSFVYYAQFNLENMAPNSHAIILLATVLYLLVFLGSFILMAQQVKENQTLIKDLIDAQKKFDTPFIEIMSNRRLIKLSLESIIFIESMSDYVIIHTQDEEIKSKEKISKVNERLPDTFIRIHRSFIVNKSKVTNARFGELEIAGQTLTIGRSYQKVVRQTFGQV